MPGPVLGAGGHVRAAHHRLVHRHDPVAGHEQSTGRADRPDVPAACARGTERAPAAPLRDDHGQVHVPDGRLRRDAHHEHKEQEGPHRDSRTREDGQDRTDHADHEGPDAEQAARRRGEPDGRGDGRRAAKSERSDEEEERGGLPELVIRLGGEDRRPRRGGRAAARVPTVLRQRAAGHAKIQSHTRVFLPQRAPRPTVREGHPTPGHG